MTKHILDRSRTTANRRLKKALATERQTGPKHATLALQRRHRGRAHTERITQFLRMERTTQT